jgi:hypothetical protein
MSTPGRGHYFFLKNKIISTHGRGHPRRGWISTPGGKHPRQGMGIHARAWTIMSMPGHGHPRPGVIYNRLYYPLLLQIGQLLTPTG